MSNLSLRRLLVRFALIAGLLTAFATPAHAGFWLGSLNTLRLGQNHPSGASQSNKKTQIKNFIATNGVTILQEVMVTSEVANVTPGGYYYKVSALKGTSSYSEAYGFVYSSSMTISGSIVNYSNSSFVRPPSGMRFWHGTAYTWVVNYHASFDSTPNATAIQLLNKVYTFYKGYTSGMNDVVIGGDFNRTATSSYFNNLKNAGCSQIQPNVATSINTSGGYANPYDHFCWNPTYTSVTNVTRESIDPVYWRNNVSDHAPISCWVAS